MALEGNFKELDLSTILQTLKMDEKEGILFIQRGQKNVNLYISKNGVRYLAPKEGDFTDFIEILLRQRIVKREEIQRYQEYSKEANLPPGQLLFQDGLITEEILQNQFAPRLAEKLFDLFDWEDAHFRFTPSPPNLKLEFFDPQDAGLFITFDIGFLNLELVRRRDEWRKIRKVIPSDDCILVFNNEYLQNHPLDKSSLSKDALRLLELIDGKKNIAQLREHSGISNFNVYSTLYELYQQNILQMLNVNYLVQEANALYQEERFLEASQRFKAAININPNNALLRLEFAKKCEERKDWAEAANQYRGVAAIYAHQNRPKEADIFYQKALKIAPQQTDLLEDYFYFLLDKKNLKDNLQEILKQLEEKLVQIYQSQKQIPKIIELYQNLQKHFPDNISCREALIPYYTQQKRNQELAKIFEELGDIYLAQGKYKNAKKYYQLLLTYNPKRNDIQQKIKGIENYIRLENTSKYKWITVSILSLLLLTTVAILIQIYLYRSKEIPQLQQQYLQTLKKYKKTYHSLLTPRDTLKQLNQDFPKIQNLRQQATETYKQVVNSQKQFEFLEEVTEKYEDFLSEVQQLEQEYQGQIDQHLEKILNQAKNSPPETALPLLKKILASNYRSSFLEEATQQYLKIVQQQLSYIHNQINKIQNLLKTKKFQQALQTSFQLLQDYPKSTTVKKIRLPLYLESLPQKAKILLNGKPYPHPTPTLLKYPPFQLNTLEIKVNGFHPLRIQFQLARKENYPTLKKLKHLSNHLYPSLEKNFLEKSILSGKLSVQLIKPPLWSYFSPNYTPQIFHATPPYLFVGLASTSSQNSAKLLCLNLAKGQKIWEFTKWISPNPKKILLLSYSKTLSQLIALCENILYSLNPDTGEKISLNSFGNQPIHIVGNHVQGYLCFANPKGNIFLTHIEKTDFRKQWNIRTQLRIPPYYYGRHLYYTSNKFLYSIHIESNDTALKRLEEPIQKKIFIHRGVLYAPGKSGVLYAIDLALSEHIGKYTFTSSLAPNPFQSILGWKGEDAILILVQKTQQSSAIEAIELKREEKKLQKLWSLPLPPLDKHSRLLQIRNWLLCNVGQTIYCFLYNPKQMTTKPRLYFKIQLHSPPSCGIQAFDFKEKGLYFLIGLNNGTILCFQQQ
ncbi:MAG: DUF4388 domain-containing protein [Planctomycetota bacterium]|nr:MAG: DUF4388 domain-containing protein [Planctomycetota bacterium]